MKDEQKVFIRGVEGRGEEVKQVLINLGGKNVHDFCYGDTEGLFFINHNGEIRYASEFSEMGKIIMDCYTELHLPEKWKDGDVLVDKYQGGVFAVFSKYRTDCDDFDTHLAASPYDIRQHIVSYVTDDFRLATPSEVERFHELLHKHHKDWDAKNKRLVDWRWKPQKDEGYYYIDNDGDIFSDTWDDFQEDDDRYSFGNCFRTKAEAEAAAERVKKALKGE